MHAERVVVMMKSVGTLEKEENMGRLHSLVHSSIYLRRRGGIEDCVGVPTYLPALLYEINGRRCQTSCLPWLLRKIPIDSLGTWSRISKCEQS